MRCCLIINICYYYSVVIHGDREATFLSENSSEPSCDMLSCCRKVYWFIAVANKLLIAFVAGRGGGGLLLLSLNIFQARF